MTDLDTRYELPATGITLLGYVVRRMHKTRWLVPVPWLIASGKTDEALARIAMYAVTCSTSFGRAYYQPRFNPEGEKFSEADPQTGALVEATLEASSPAYKISCTVTMPNGDLFAGREEIAGTTFSLHGLGMPAPSSYHFVSGNYSAEMRGILTSELAFAFLGRTRIRAFGSLILKDKTGNTAKVIIDRGAHIGLELNGMKLQIPQPSSEWDRPA